MKNLIRVHGEINEESFISFDRKLTTLENKKQKTVYVKIISEGGEAYSALAFYDRIKSSPSKIITIATGLVASAASLVFIAGHERYMTRNAWFMVHEDSLAGLDDMKIHQIEKEASHARRLENEWNDLMALSTGIHFSTWEKWHKEETYMSFDDCAERGIIHGAWE